MTAISNSLHSNSLSIYLPQQRSIPPTKKEAQEIFWGLGDSFWMQIIDGKFHQHGPMVFDEGLHNPDKKEPGFFASLKSGCELASEHLTEGLSVHFYKELHKKLCAHFNGNENNVLMSNAETGIFRNDSVSFTYTDLLSPDSITSELWTKYKCREKFLALNKYIMQFSNQFQIPTIAWISAWEDTGIKIEYRCTSSHDHERIIQFLFNDYRQKIDLLNMKLDETTSTSEIDTLVSDKVEAIADLFQKLEWLHPFPDGQGRTDLVLQAKLLSEEGLSPAILQNPYVSTYLPLPEWKAHLLEGIKKWKEEKGRVQVAL